MRQKCDCGKVYGQKGDLKNGTVTGGMCMDCFINWLQNFMKKIESKGDPKNRLPFLRKLLTNKLIQRQDALIMTARGGGYR